jgi:hypothetical protein
MTLHQLINIRRVEKAIEFVDDGSRGKWQEAVVTYLQVE